MPNVRPPIWMDWLGEKFLPFKVGGAGSPSHGRLSFLTEWQICWNKIFRSFFHVNSWWLIFAKEIMLMLVVIGCVPMSLGGCQTNFTNYQLHQTLVLHYLYHISITYSYLLAIIIQFILKTWCILLCPGSRCLEIWTNWKYTLILFQVCVKHFILWWYCYKGITYLHI